MPKIVELLRSETARPEKATPASSRICSAACEHVELSCATRANHSDTRTIGVHALWEGLMTSHLLMFRPLYVKIVQLSRGTRAAGYLTLSLNCVRFCWWAGSIVAAVEDGDTFYIVESRVLGRLVCQFCFSKMTPFHKRQENIIFCKPKLSIFITFILEFLFDTVALITPCFRMIKARCCKYRCKSSLS